MYRYIIFAICIAFFLGEHVQSCKAQQRDIRAAVDNSTDRDARLFFEKLGFSQFGSIDEAINSIASLDTLPIELFKSALLDENPEHRRLAMHIFCRKQSAASAQVCLAALNDDDPNVIYLGLLGLRLNHKYIGDATFQAIRLLTSDKRRVQNVSIDSYGQVPIACDSASFLADVGFNGNGFVASALEECVAGNRILGKALTPFEQMQVRLMCSVILVNHANSPTATKFLILTIESEDQSISEEAIVSCYHLKSSAGVSILEKIVETLENVKLDPENSEPCRELASSVVKFIALEVAKK